MARCRSCGRRLHQPTPDGYGPRCRRAMRPPPASGHSPTRAPGPPTTGQLALNLEPAPGEDTP
jgi:hypothetical protein